MTWEQYWEQDSSIVKYYRRAYEIRQEEANRNAWLQGMYVYEAIADIAPILHAFAKKGTKARKYSEKPYEFKKPERKAGRMNRKDSEAKAKADKIQMKMLAFVQQQEQEKKRKDQYLLMEKQAEEAGYILEETQDGKVRITEGREPEEIRTDEQ